MDTTGSPAKNTAFGTVANAGQTGGALGPGQGTMDFSMQGMNPIRVMPMTKAAGAVSNYHVEFLASTSVPLAGQIMLTFPAGFDLSQATATPSVTSFCNADINGPASGTTVISSVANDNGAGTITITLGGAATGNNAFLCMDLTGIVNSTIPNASGYNIDIKTKDTAGNNRAVLETKTAAPFFLGAVGTRTLTVNVFNDANTNGVKDGGEGIANTTVFLFSPQSGGQEATTTSVGVATFANLADGDYMVGVKPGTVGNVAFNSAPQPVNISANTTKNFALAAAPYTIAGSVTGPVGTKVDVFGSSQTGFTKTTLTLTGGADAYSLPATGSTTYNVGVGPAIPETFTTPGAPPPPMPTFTFMPPAPITVSIINANATGKNFVLAATSKTITGTVRDSSAGAVSNTGVFCRPVQDSSFAATSSVGFGSGTMTDTTGAFTINITPGVYLCGAFKPGMPPVSDKQITVPASGANTPATLSFTLGAGTSLTVSGTVKDETGNAVAYSGVNARKVTSTGDTTPLGGGAQNFVGGPTDANGAYTLYVTNGTWVIDAFAPGFGKLTSKTVTVAGTSLTGQDFSAQTMSLGTITGSTTQAGSPRQGVMVRADSSGGSNMAVSDITGSYSIKVPSGTYALKCFFPGTGDGTPVTGISVTSNTVTSGQNCAVAAPITVTVNLTDGTNPIQNAFVDARDSNGRGNNTNQSTISGVNAVYTLTLPPGTYTVRAGHPAYGQIGTAGTATTTQTLTMTATAGSLFAMTGTVLASSVGVNGAWVSLTGVPTGQTNVINIGTQTASSGVFTLNAPAGSYRLRADKPGFKSGAETNVTVTAAGSLGTITLTTAARTITGTVTLSAVGVANAFVDATDGAGGFAVSQTDATGAYSLAIDSGTWTLRAHSMGYDGTLSGVVVGGSNVSGQTIALTAISGFTMTQERQETVTPTAGGLLSNSDIGSSFKLNIPANALGTGSNAGTVKTQVNTAVPSPVTGSVLAKNAISISAVDSSGSPIKNLNSPVTVVVPYTDTGLTAAQEANLSLGVWNDAAQSYDVLSATVDTAANTLTAMVSHFSDFAPLSSEGVATPAPTPAPAPAPTSSGGGGGAAIPLSLLNPGSQPAVATPVSLAAAPTVSTTPAPVISPVSGPRLTRTLKIGSKDEEVKLLQQYLITEGFLIMPAGVSLGYFGQVTRTALMAYQKSIGLEAVGELGPKTRAAILSSGHAQAAPAGKAVGLYSFTLPLKQGSKGTDVTKLQEILVAKGFLVMPAGVSHGYYGALTVAAVKEYQKSFGIEQLGIVGPATRKALNTAQ
jgi:peptidoglycan hydrolase-like protein with peptidoglycan-binding domain